MRLTVAIPTRNRRDRLAETLEALAARDVPERFEVVVVDDGSTDETPDFLSSFAPTAFDFRSERLPGSGPAKARNRAVQLARGERVLFLGDDTRPAPGTLAVHMAGDAQTAIQGHIDWDPEAEITEVMDFLAPEGPQFYFRGLQDDTAIPYTAVLGSNFSAPTAWLRDEPYDEGFPDAAFEDTEMAYRWQERGWQAIYKRQALCWHHHHYGSILPFLERQKRAGRAARYALGLHRALWWPVILKPLLFHAYFLARHGGGIVYRRLRHRADEPITWEHQSRVAFLKGFLESP